MKPRRIAALGFAALLAAVVVAGIFGVPAGFLAKYAQDQAIRSGYRLRIDGSTTVADLIGSIYREYRVEPQKVIRDVLNLLTCFEADGLIHHSRPANSPERGR